MLLGLWSRGYEATRAVVVKATSSAGRLAPRLLGRSPASRAVYLNLAAEPYLATLLGGANSADGPARPRPRPHAPPAGRPRAAGRAAATRSPPASSPRSAGWSRACRRQPRRKRRVRACSRSTSTHFSPTCQARFRSVLAHFGLPRDEAVDRGDCRKRGAAPVFEGARAAIPARRARCAPRGRAPRPLRRDRARARLARAAGAGGCIHRCSLRAAASHEHGRRGPPGTARQASSSRAGLPTPSRPTTVASARSRRTPSRASTSPASCGAAAGSKRRSKSTRRRSTSASRSPRKCSRTWP